MKTVMCQVEMVVFSNKLFMFAKRSLAKKISNSYNDISEELVSWRDVEHQNFAQVSHKIIRFLILSAKVLFHRSVKWKDRRLYLQKNHNCVFLQEQ